MSSTEDVKPTNLPTATVQEQVRAKLKRLEALQAECADLEAYMANPHESDSEELSGLKQQILDLSEVIEESTAEKTAAIDRAYALMTAAVEERLRLGEKIGELVGEIKALLLAEEIEGRKARMDVLLDSGFGVRRNKTTKTVVAYDSKAILKKYPELLTANFDGDNLFTPVISPELADRMLEKGLLPADLRTFRSEAFARAPGIEFVAPGSNTKGGEA